MSEISKKKDNWTKEIWWTYGILRKSDLFFFVLPGFYFVFMNLVILYILKKDNILSFLKVFFDYISVNTIVAVFVVFPLFLILIYTVWLILNIAAARYFVKRKEIYDQMYSSNIFDCSDKTDIKHEKVNWFLAKLRLTIKSFKKLRFSNSTNTKVCSKYAKVINDNIENVVKHYKEIFFDKNNIERKKKARDIFYDNITLYWNIFQYVMEEYYWKENVYDDLRKALFIRNIAVATLTLFWVVLIVTVLGIAAHLFKSSWMTLWIEQIFISIMTTLILYFTYLLFVKAYSSQIKFYLFKLFLTFNYLTSKNVKK